MTVPTSHEGAGLPLADALRAARDALAAGDAVAASAAAAEAWERCADLQAKGLAPDPALAAEASELVSDCLAAAGALETALGREMESVNASRRAHAAYARI